MRVLSLAEIVFVIITIIITLLKLLIGILTNHHLFFWDQLKPF